MGCRIALNLRIAQMIQSADVVHTFIPRVLQRQWQIGLSASAHERNWIYANNGSATKLFSMINFTNFPSGIYCGHRNGRHHQLHMHVFRQQVSQIIFFLQTKPGKICYTLHLNGTQRLFSQMHANTLLHCIEFMLNCELHALLPTTKKRSPIKSHRSSHRIANNLIRPTLLCGSQHCLNSNSKAMHHDDDDDDDDLLMAAITSRSSLIIWKLVFKLQYYPRISGQINKWQILSTTANNFQC